MSKSKIWKCINNECEKPRCKCKTDQTPIKCVLDIDEAKWVKEKL